MGIIQTIEGEDSSSWYEMWEAVQAIIGMCLRFGQWGTAIKRGMLPHTNHPLLMHWKKRLFRCYDIVPRLRLLSIF